MSMWYGLPDWLESSGKDQQKINTWLGWDAWVNADQEQQANENSRDEAEHTAVSIDR